MNKGIERLFAGNGAFTKRILVLKFDFVIGIISFDANPRIGLKLRLF